MAVLSDGDRKVAAKEVIKELFVKPNLTASLNTDDIKAAVDATDSWIDGNQVAFNSTLPEPFKSSATLEQKTIMFAYVAFKRAGLI